MERLEFLDLANEIVLEDNKERAIEIICKYIKEISVTFGFWNVILNDFSTAYIQISYLTF